MLFLFRKDKRMIIRVKKKLGDDEDKSDSLSASLSKNDVKDFFWNSLPVFRQTKHFELLFFRTAY